MRIRTSFFFSGIIFFWLFPVLALADTPASAVPAGLVSCSALFPASRITVNLQNSSPVVSAGQTLSLTGVIKNASMLPIDKGVLYLKIYRLSGSSADAVDFMVGARDLSIAAGTSKTVSFPVQIPSGIISGKYRIVAVVTPGIAFDPEGALVFANPSGNGIFDFSISSGPKTTVTLLPKGEKISLSGNSGEATSTRPIELSVPVQNNTKSVFSGKVDWSLYAWDASDPEHPISAASTPFTAAAGATTHVSYLLTDTSHALYYVVGTVTTPGGVKSIAGFTLWRYGTSGVRISYVSASQVPLVSGNPAAVACITSAGATQPDVEFTLSVKQTGLLSFLGPIASASYKGKAPLYPSALTAAANSDASSFDVTGHLYMNGQLVDTVTVPYRCGKIYGTCTSSPWTMVSLTAAFLIALGGVIYILRGRRKNVTL